MNARKSTAFLYFLGKLQPKAWDALFPHGPRVSRAGREYLIAQSIKGFAGEIVNRGISTKLAGIQKRLVEASAKSLVADYGDDDWCPTRPKPPIPFPEPGPFPWFSFSDVMLNPQPLPPKAIQREIGGYLIMLSEVTSLDDVSRDLAAVGNSLLGGPSSTMKRPSLGVPPSRLGNVRTLISGSN